MGFAECFLHTYVDTCFSSYLLPLCNHCSDEVWPMQNKIMMWDGGFNGKTSFVFHPANPFLLLLFDKLGFAFSSEALTMVDCAFPSLECFCFRSLAYKEESLCSVPFGSQLRTRTTEDTRALPCSALFLLRELKQTGCFVWTFCEVAISSTKCLRIPKSSNLPCILGTRRWRFTLLSGRFGDACLMGSVNELISMVFSQS